MIRRTFYRTLGIIKKMWGIFLFYFLSLFLFTIVIYIWTFGSLGSRDIGENSRDSEEYYNYSYANVRTIFVTLLLMVTTNNTPDMAVGDPQHRLLYTTFYVTISLFNLVLESGVILAIINHKYRLIFEQEVQEFKNLNEYQRRMIE